MKPREKVLVVLLVLVTGGVIYWQFFSGSLTGGANPGATADGTKIPSGAGRINTDSLDSAEGRASLGRNPFSFKREIVTAPPPPPLPPPQPPPPPPTPPPPRPGPTGPTGPTTPAGPNLPNVPLQYTGYARDDANEMVAFLETNGTGAPVGHYNLREDDFLLGRFRVNKITIESVEVEDMDRAENASNRKQSIPITPTLAPKK
jgi:hypothetical protein